MSKKASEATEQPYLFDIPEAIEEDSRLAEPAVKAIDFPIWTDNKARLITCYLHYFVLLTKHGTYIDGFAGPQQECDTDCWAAKLVLASEPRWIKHFHLCDEKRSQVLLLDQLKTLQPHNDAKGRKLYRKIHIHQGDFNSKIDEILATGNISQKQATFCLLDQRTFECEWRTVEKLAKYKRFENKIELFYFLANGWLERALHAQKDQDVLARWWGREDWTTLKQMTRDERRDAIVHRMKKDLGYKSVKAWPIYERDDGGAVMYYMIHATDHPEAPKFMSRAYRRAVFPLEPIEQLTLGLIAETKVPLSHADIAPLSIQRSA